MNETNENSCCICGTVKNCGKYLEKVLENMETIGAIFSSFKIIISYDVSSDNSLEILQKYEKMHSDTMILHVNTEQLYEYRVYNIAKARNKCLDIIREQFLTCKYFIMMDCDDVCSSIRDLEPLKYYLDKLPNNDKVIKVNCAISNIDFETNIFWISPEDIKKYNLPNWLRGCNSIVDPHPTAINELNKVNLLHIYKTSICKCITWNTLVNTYDVTSVNLLKIDTEGHDCKIIQNILHSNTVFPNEILFEYNILTNKDEFKNTIDLLTDNGYYEIEKGFDTIKVKKQ